MHYPIGSFPARRPAHMENQRLLHAERLGMPSDLPVLSSGLPVPELRCSVRPSTVRVLLVRGTEEVPFSISALQAGSCCIFGIPEISIHEKEFRLVLSVRPSDP